MKQAGSLGLYFSFYFMEDFIKRSIRSKGSRMAEIIKAHIPCKNVFMPLSFPEFGVWVDADLGQVPERAAFQGVISFRPWALWIVGVMGTFDTSFSKLLFYFTRNAGVSLAVETEEGGEISRCSEMITKTPGRQLCFGLNRHYPNSCPRACNNRLPGLRANAAFN